MVSPGPKELGPSGRWPDLSDEQPDPHFLTYLLHETRLADLRRIVDIPLLRELRGCDVTLVDVSHAGLDLKVQVVRWRASSPGQWPPETISGSRHGSWAKHLADEKLLVSWDPLETRLDDICGLAPRLAVKDLAKVVWGHRLGLAAEDHRAITREVLDAPAGIGPSHSVHGAMVSGAILTYLVLAVREPALLVDAQDVAGLGILAAGADHLPLALDCMTWSRGEVPGLLETTLDIEITKLLQRRPALRGTAEDHWRKEEPERAQQELVQRRKNLYRLVEVERMLRLKARPACPGMHLRRSIKTKWGLPSHLSKARRQEAVALRQISIATLETLFADLTVGDDQVEGLHASYRREFLAQDNIIERPAWYEEKLFAGRWRGETRILELEDMIGHLLHRGYWQGFQICTQRFRVPNPDYEGDLLLAGDRDYLVSEWIEVELDEPVTAVLVLDLDQHGNEKVDLETRYKIISERLPGAIVFRSSSSGGIHCWYFLPQLMEVMDIYTRVMDLLDDAVEQLGERGLEVFPRPGCANNVRIFGGLGSLLLDEELNPVCRASAPIGLLLEMLPRMIDEQRPRLGYLLEPLDTNETNPRSENSRSVAAGTAKKQPRVTDYPIWEVVPAGAVPTPSLIKDGEQTWNNRHSVAGRALAQMWRRGLINGEEDLGTAQAILDWWLRRPINSCNSSRLSGSERTAKSRRIDLVSALTFLYADFIKSRLGGSAGRQKNASPASSGRGATNGGSSSGATQRIERCVLDLNEEDRLAVARLVDEYQIWKGTRCLSSRQRECLQNVLCRVVVAIHAAQKRDKDMFLTKMYLCNRKWPANARLHATKNSHLRPTTLYYRRVLEFLIEREILLKTREDGRRVQYYAPTWPPPARGEE